MTAGFCAACGTALTGGRFCPGCGREVVTAEPATASMPPLGGHAARAQRAAESADAGMMPSGNGATAVAAPPEAPTPPPVRTVRPPVVPPSDTAAPAAGRGPGRRTLWAVLGLVVVAAIAAVVVVVVLNRGSGGGTSDSAFSQKVSQAFAPVAAANARLSDALGALHGNDTVVARRATQTGESATSSAEGALNALTVPSGSAAFAGRVRQALDREQTYLSAVGAVLADPTSPSVGQVQSLEGNLTTALDAAGGPLTGASQGVAGADTLTAWAHRQASRRHGGQSTQSTSGSSSSGPQTSAPTTRDCGAGLTANSNTSCPFAQNVQSAYYAQGSNPTVYSPVTGQTYDMNCTNDGSTVTCTGGNDAVVSWSQG